MVVFNFWLCFMKDNIAWLWRWTCIGMSAITVICLISLRGFSYYKSKPLNEKNIWIKKSHRVRQEDQLYPFWKRTGFMILQMCSTEATRINVLLVYNHSNKSHFVRLPIILLNPQPFSFCLDDGESSYNLADIETGREKWISESLSRLYHLPGWDKRHMKKCSLTQMVKKETSLFSEGEPQQASHRFGFLCVIKLLLKGS